MKKYYFQLDLPYAQCLDLYQPGNNVALVRAESGEKVQLPCLNLRPYVSRLGLNGRFRLIIDDNNKVMSFEKVN